MKESPNPRPARQNAATTEIPQPRPQPTTAQNVVLTLKVVAIGLIVLLVLLYLDKVAH